jgi:hypothetical protein
MCALSILRILGLLVGGCIKATVSHELILTISPQADNPDWGILQSPFLKKKEKILGFKREVTISGNTLSYTQEMTLDIYGMTFNHIDKNTLVNVN